MAVTSEVAAAHRQCHSAAPRLAVLRWPGLLRRLLCGFPMASSHGPVCRPLLPVDGHHHPQDSAGIRLAKRHGDGDRRVFFADDVSALVHKSGDEELMVLPWHTMSLSPCYSEEGAFAA